MQDHMMANSIEGSRIFFGTEVSKLSPYHRDEYPLLTRIKLKFGSPPISSVGNIHDKLTGGYQI